MHLRGLHISPTRMEVVKMKPLSLRGNWMSHFDTFRWDGGEARLTPKGLRGHPLLRWAWIFPFPSGMRLDLKVKMTMYEELREEERIYIQLFRDGTEGTIGSATVALGQRREEEASLERLTYNGTYRLNAYRRLGVKTLPTELERGFASVHIIPNYIAWLVFYNPAVGILLGVISRLL